MTKTGKIVVAIIIIVVVIWLGYYVSSKQQALNESVKIGVILPLTGGAAIYGLSAKEGIDLALGELNNNQIELIFEDSQCNPEKAVSAARKLIDVNGIKVIIGHICSSAALAVAPITEANKVILFSPGASSPDLTYAGDYVFRNRQDISGEVSETAKIVKDFGISNIGIIYVNNDYGIASRNIFKEKFTELGGKILIEESYQQESVDFRTQLTKIKEVNPEAIFLVGLINESAIIVKQSHELGVQSQFFSTIGIEGKELIEIAGPAAEGIIYTAPFFDVNSNESTVKEFVDNFKTMYQKDPTYVFAANGYDALKILDLVINQCGKIDSDCIRDELYKIENFKGASGITTFNEYGDVTKPVMVKTIKNGEFILYEK